MQCKSCGRDVKSDFKYCPYCSSRLINDFQDQYDDLIPPTIIDTKDDKASVFYADDPNLTKEAFFPTSQVDDDASTIKIFESDNNYTDVNFNSKTNKTVKQNLKSEQTPYLVYRPEDENFISDMPGFKDFGNTDNLYGQNNSGEIPPAIEQKNTEENFISFDIPVDHSERNEKNHKYQSRVAGIGFKICLIISIISLALILSFATYHFLWDSDSVNSVKANSTASTLKTSQQE